jgi:Cu-Zn family superoxide dismutase
MKFTILAACCALTAAPAAMGAEANADVRDRNGTLLGAVYVRDTPSGSALATVQFEGAPEGVHAIHLHETGDCSAADFTSAGGHIAGDRQHGVLAEGGPHPGDMPNLTVDEDGAVQIAVFLPYLDVQRDLLDGDGAAFIMHEGVDDYESQPSGDAGARIACGVFEEEAG